MRDTPSGYIKLFRRLTAWEWYKESPMVHLLVHLIMMANRQPGRWKGVELQRGQLITGRHALSLQTGITERTCRTCLERLKTTREIAIETTNRYTLITLLNYDTYQDRNDRNDHAGDQTDATFIQIDHLIHYHGFFSLLNLMELAVFQSSLEQLADNKHNGHNLAIRQRLAWEGWIFHRAKGAPGCPWGQDELTSRTEPGVEVRVVDLYLYLLMGSLVLRTGLAIGSKRHHWSTHPPVNPSIDHHLPGWQLASGRFGDGIPRRVRRLRWPPGG